MIRSLSSFLLAALCIGGVSLAQAEIVDVVSEAQGVRIVSQDLLLKDGSDELRISVDEAGRLRVLVNGQVDTSDRVTIKKDGSLEVRDRSGAQRARIHASGTNVILQTSRPEPRLGYVGASFANIDLVLAEQLSLDPESVSLVTMVVPGQAAEKAGLKANDILTQIDSDPASPSQITRTIQKKKPGDQFTVRLLRRGKPEEFTVTLGERREEWREIALPSRKRSMIKDNTENLKRLAEAEAQMKEVNSKMAATAAERELERATAAEMKKLAEDLHAASSRTNDRGPLILKSPPTIDPSTGRLVVMDRLDALAKLEDRRAQLDENLAKMDSTRDAIRSLETRLAEMEKLLRVLVESQQNPQKTAR